MYGEGISKEGDLLDLAVDRKIVDKSGTWFAFNGERLGQGRENVKQFLQRQPGGRQGDRRPRAPRAGAGEGRSVRSRNRRHHERGARPGRIRPSSSRATASIVVGIALQTPDLLAQSGVLVRMGGGRESPLVYSCAARTRAANPRSPNSESATHGTGHEYQGRSEPPRSDTPRDRQWHTVDSCGHPPPRYRATAFATGSPPLSRYGGDSHAHGTQTPEKVPSGKVADRRGKYKPRPGGCEARAGAVIIGVLPDASSACRGSSVGRAPH